ncbi:MAG: hypothetical protein ACYC01_11895 [Lutibacter sp.]
MAKPKDNKTTPLKTSNLELSVINLNDLFKLIQNTNVVKFAKKEADKSKEYIKKFIQKTAKGIQIMNFII